MQRNIHVKEDSCKGIFMVKNIHAKEYSCKGIFMVKAKR
jgi:hypothetical protein